MLENSLPILLSVIVVLCSILIFFITNSLKKIDNIVRVEEKLELYLKMLEDTTREIKNLFSKSVNIDQEIIRLKALVENNEKRILKLEEVESERDRD